MARLRQQNPNNYVSSANISSEFENVIRYLNAAELGNKTLGELLSQIFNEEGEFDGPIEIRLDPTAGLQYRVGEYDEEDDGWLTIATMSEVRGPPGRDVGDIGAPILYGYLLVEPAASDTQITYAFDSGDDLLVYVDGLLQTPTDDYTSDHATDTITFNAAFAGTEKVTLYKIRATQITGYHRADFETVTTQSVFPFVHDDTDVLQVYLNGILQNSGGANDYVSNAATDTVTFLSPLVSGNKVSIITVENTSTTAVTGLMMEENYADPETGLILYDRIAIEDDEIPQAKVDGLVTALTEAGKITVGSTAPLSPDTGDQWQDTSGSQDVLKFWDGTDWLATSPTSGLPAFTASDAGKRIEVNSLGTALIYAYDDFSSLIPLTQKAAANGVATLDSTGRLPTTQLPVSVSSDTIYKIEAGAVSNGTFTSKRVYRQLLSLTGVAIHLTSGTCSVQLAIDGVGVGSVYAATSAGLESVFTTAQTVDARTTSKKVGFIVTGASSPVDLEVTIAASIQSS